MYNKSHLSQKGRTSFVAILLVGVVCGMMTASVVKVISLKTNPPEELQDHTVQVISKHNLIAKRGDILDRRGRILAASRIGHFLFVDPSLIDDYEEVAFQLSNCIDMPPADIELIIRQRQTTKYAVISTLLKDQEVESLRSLHLRCVGIKERLIREYPHGDSCAPLIGLVGTEHTGLAGFENTFNENLEGESGLYRRLRDSRKRTLWVSPEDYVPSQDGKDVHMSIDVVIQNIAVKRLQKEIDRCNAGGGRIVVVDPTTGEILAMADLLNTRLGWPQQLSDPLREIDPRLGRNRCVTDPYEPGSTFKPFVWSVATELGKAKIDEILQTPTGSPYRTPFGRFIRDARYYGPSTWKKVLVKSMNSGMAIVAQRMSHLELQQAIGRFGFGESTQLGLGGETKGIVTSPSNWSNYTQTSVSMGHEIAVTPLQMVQGFCAFARDGTVPQLRITQTSDEQLMIVRQAISEKTSTLTRKILGEVMTEGTGRRAQSDLYELFGKSGTAQLPKQQGKGYFEDRYISSFIAGAPLNNPKLVVLCVIDDPDKSIDHYGGVVAGPVVRDVIDATLQYLGVPPTDNITVVQASK